MADVAQLGIAVDSSQLKQGVAELRNFENAAKRTNDAVGQSQKVFADASKRVGEAANQNKAMATSTGLARHELVNLSRQLQDVGVSLASGQSPFLVAIQQGTQMADIFGSSKTGTVGGALKQITSGVLNFLTPMRLAGGALAIVGAGGAIAYSSLKQSALAFDDLSRSVGTTVGQLRGLQSAAGYKGIGTEDFTKGMERFGQSVYDAKNNMGGLAEVFRANNASANTFNGYLYKAADLIKNAKDDQTRLQLLQQMGLPATMQWVRFLSQGADGIRKATEEAGKFNESAEGKLLASARKFDEAWDRATTNVSNKFKSWGLGAYEWLDGIISRASNAAGWMTRAFAGAPEPERAPIRIRITGGTTETKPTATVDPAAAARRNQLELSYVSILGQQAGVKEVLRGVDAQIRQYNAQPGAIALTEKQVATMRRLAEEQNLGLTQIKASTDAYRIEGDTIGMTTGAAAAYTAAQTILNEKKRLGVELSAEQRAAIESEAAAMGRAAQSVENTRFAYDTSRSMVQSFSQNLRSGQSAWQAFGNAATDALGRIQDKILDLVFNQAWTALMGGKSGGGLGGLFGNLFGGGGTVANGGIVLGGAAGPGIFAAANGGTFGPGWGIVGERGPEIINVHQRGVTVYPNHISKPYMPGFAIGGTLSPQGNVTRLPFGQNNAAPVTFGDIHISVPEGTSPQDAGAIGREVREQLSQMVDERLRYHTRPRGMMG